MKLRISALFALTACQPLFSSDRFDGSKAGEQRVIAGVRLCWCPAGRFRMGSPRDEPDHQSDEEQVDVTLSRGFWMGKFEATQGEWSKIAGAFPHEMDRGAGDEFPVYWVNYGEAEEFARKLTAMARRSGELPRDWEFRLPTEAQWEYATRAGAVTATSFGNSLGNKQANFAGKPYNGGEPGPAPGHASKVGSYPANACTSGAATGITGGFPAAWTRIFRACGELRMEMGRSRACGGAGVSGMTGKHAGRRGGTGMNRSGERIILGFAWWRWGSDGARGLGLFGCLAYRVNVGEVLRPAGGQLCGYEIVT